MGDWEQEREPAVLGQMLELLAHDLRNPLSALHSNLGYLRTIAARESIPADVHEAIADGLVSCEGLAHIIDNLGQFAQLLRATQAPPAPPDLVDAFVSDALQRTESVARAYGSRVELTLTNEARGLRLALSRDPFSRVLTNLVLNAIQCSPRRSPVAVRVDRSGNEVRIEVDDMGAPPADPQPFGIAAQLATKTASDGRYNRWLGLYIAAITAQSLGGSLAVAPATPPFTSKLRLLLPAHQTQ